MKLDSKIYVAGHRAPASQGWRAKVALAEGIQLAYQDFLKNYI